MSRALVLLAHGSTDPRWRAPFEDLRRRLAAALQQVSPAPVALAYLQLCSPTLAQALRECSEAGASRALVIPLFLSGGGHLLRDVPRLVAQAAGGITGLEVRCAGAVGEQPEVAQALLRACLRLGCDP